MSKIDENDNQTAAKMRPILMLMAGANIAIAALLITTAALGASPVVSNAYEIASR